MSCVGEFLLWLAMESVLSVLKKVRLPGLQILGIHITFERQFLVDQYYNYDGQDNSI